jgi:hypothetical protein
LRTNCRLAPESVAQKPKFRTGIHHDRVRDWLKTGLLFWYPPAAQAGTYWNGDAMHLDKVARRSARCSFVLDSVQVVRAW